MDQETFDQNRRELSGMDPLAKLVKLAEIQLDEDSIVNSCIHLYGNRIPVSRAFFNRLGQIVGLNLGLMNKMDKKQDRELQLRLIEAVKAYIQRDNSKDYFLIGDPDKNQIVDIVRAEARHRLTNDSMFRLADTLLNEIPDLGVESIDRDGNGNMSINLVHSADHSFDKLGADETFRFGLSLTNTTNESKANNYLERLSCSNGMISKMPVDDGPKKPRLGGGGGDGTSPAGFLDIINRAHIWANNGFIPTSFEDRLRGAIETRASLFEMQNAYNTAYFQIEEPDPDRKIWIARSVKSNFFPALEATERRLISKGVDPTSLNQDQQKFVRTDISVWDLVNDLTWMGSHDSTYGLTNHKKFKVAGGNLFVKKWDLEHAQLADL